MFSHHMSDDGLTLTSNYHSKLGITKTVTLSWPNAKMALSKTPEAIREFEARAEKHEHDVQKSLEEKGATHSWLRRWGPVELFVTTGPPTWRWPRFTRVEKGRGAGWLRFAFIVSWRG